MLWGTLFPVISEAVTGEKISVDAPFFNKVNIPIGLFLLLLTGVGPLIAWRRSSFESLKRAFLWPTIGARGSDGRAVRDGRSSLLRADVVRALPVRDAGRSCPSSSKGRGRSAPRPGRICCARWWS